MVDRTNMFSCYDHVTSTSYVVCDDEDNIIDGQIDRTSTTATCVICMHIWCSSSADRERRRGKNPFRFVQVCLSVRQYGLRRRLLTRFSVATELEWIYQQQQCYFDDVEISWSMTSDSRTHLQGDSTCYYADQHMDARICSLVICVSTTTNHMMINSNRE